MIRAVRRDRANRETLRKFIKQEFTRIENFKRLLQEHEASPKPFEEFNTMHQNCQEILIDLRNHIKKSSGRVKEILCDYDSLVDKNNASMMDFLDSEIGNEAFLKLKISTMVNLSDQIRCLETLEIIMPK